MVISESNCSILKYLKWDKTLWEHKDASELSIYECDQSENAAEACKFVFDSWNDIQKRVSNNIDVISQQFYESMIASWDSFAREEILKEIKGKAISGTILINFNKLAICYEIKCSNNGDFNCFICAFSEYTNLVCCSGFNRFITSNPIVLNSRSEDQFYNHIWGIPIIFHLFKKYAKVETKFIAKQSRVKNSNGEKDINSTAFDLNMYDCTWFTNIVRSEEFKVGGHFRLQPKKDDSGEWTKELIYINEFKKNGYTRTAKILTTNYNLEQNNGHN